MKAVHAFARTMQIDCESWEGGTVDVFFDAEELRLAREAVAEMERLGGGEREEWCRYRFWAGRETEERFLIPRALGAVEYAAGSLSAYAFATGVLRLAVKKGLNLQTEMPVTAIRKAAEGWCVEFARGGGGGEERGGKILAGKVILATNGYTAHLLPELQGVIMPLRGHVTAQRPGANLPSHGLQRTYSFIYASGFDYLISRGQASSFAGDIVIGGGLTKTHQQGLYEYGNTDDASTDENTMRYLRHSARSFFGSRWGADHSDGLVRCEWSGIMGYSPDGYPLVGEMPGKRGLFLAAAFQGHGMVLSFLAARALVLIMMGADAGARTGAGAGAEERELDAWFPAAFRVSEERVARRFQARLHVTAAKGVEVGSVDDG